MALGHGPCKMLSLYALCGGYFPDVDWNAKRLGWYRNHRKWKSWRGREDGVTKFWHSTYVCVGYYECIAMHSLSLSITNEFGIPFPSSHHFEKVCWKCTFVFFWTFKITSHNAYVHVWKKWFVLDLNIQLEVKYCRLDSQDHSFSRFWST